MTDFADKIRRAVLQQQWAEASTRATFALLHATQLAAELKFVAWAKAVVEAAALMNKAKEIRRELDDAAC